MQQYIELVRTGEPDRLIDATFHAKRYLQEQPGHAPVAAGLLAYAFERDKYSLNGVLKVTRY